MSLAALLSAALAAGPFEKIRRQLERRRQIVGANGHREPIRCREDYTEAKGGAALNQVIVCASESFGESVQGYWKEAARDVSGQVSGHFSAGRFEGEFNAPAFSAALTSNGRTQAVSIQPRGGDVSDVRIELRRRG
jgi:hypothetical protein